MVISEKYKYVFVGIPYSGSSAISKELCLQYDGEPVLAKHANIQMLLKTGIDLSTYTVAAVIRNPLEMLTTHFYNMKHPKPGWFKDPKFNIENGGHLRKVDRQRYADVQDNNLSFDDYLNKYHRIPFDTFFSMNKPYLDCVIEFSDLSNSFKQFLLTCGITPARDLPVVNKSINKMDGASEVENIPTSLQPFMYENRQYLGPDIAKPNWAYNTFYKLLKQARFIRWKRYDATISEQGYCSYYDLVDRHQRSTSRQID